jgi:hypothetical protein
VATIEKEPQMRCRQIRNRIQFIKTVFGEEVQKRIQSRISKTTLQAIEQAEEDQWLPVKLNVEVSDCMAAEIGEEGVYKLSLESFNKALESSTIVQLFRSTMHLLRIKSATVNKLVPVFWRAIYRDCGEMSIVENGPNRISILLIDLPSFIAGNRNYLMAIAGGIHSVMLFGGVTPTVVIEKNLEETKEVSFAVSWVAISDVK